MQLYVTGFVKLWRKLLGAEVSVKLDSTNITITKKGNTLNLPLNEIDLFDIQKGWFSDRLVIGCDNQIPIVLKGYKSELLNTFKQHFIQSLLALIATSERWQIFQTSIEQFASLDVYLSSSEWLPIAQLHQLVSRFTGLGIDASQLTNLVHQTVFEQAKKLSKEDVSELGRELHNQSVVPILLKKHADFFDSVEKLPLTEKQRIACVTNDDHNLVIAGAGTGKTATLVGKAGFLVEANIAKPKNVLMLAFGNKAATEMNERIKDRIPSVAQDIKASTFHALGNEIVANFAVIKKRLPLLWSNHCNLLNS